MLLSPNEQRALKYSEASLEEKRLRGETNPKVVVSVGGTDYAVRSNQAPPPVIARGAAPPDSKPPTGVLVHTPWTTPTPRALAELVRGR